MTQFHELLDGPLLWIGQFSLVIQIALCVHVYRTGRPFWWIWIILMAPFIGGLLYAFMELLPDARRTGRHVLNFSWFIPKSVIIRRLQEELEDSETLERRLTLAALLYEAGRKEEADEVASPAVSGVFKDDPMVIAEVCWYKLELGRAQEAQRLLACANTKSNKAMIPRLALLTARVQFCNQAYAEAKAAFDGLHSYGLGEEPRFYSAECLAKLGDREGAEVLYRDIIKKYRKGNPVWRRSEKSWFKAAKERLYSRKSSAPERVVSPAPDLISSKNP
jgi:hypothetical protein